MRLVHVITGLGIGGAESMLFQLLRASDRATQNHFVLTLTSVNPLAPEIEALGVPVTYLGADGPFGGFMALLKAKRLIKAFKPDLVMTWMHHSDLFGVILKALMPALPLVWNIRCSKLSHGELPRRNLLIVRLLAYLSWVPKAIIANSVAGQREHIAMGYRKSDWYVLPNGFDTTRFRPDWAAGVRVRGEVGIPADSFTIGLVGRYHSMKGFDLFIRTGGRLARTSSNIHFAMVGSEVDSGNHELMQLIAANGLEGRITLLGQRTDIADVMNAFDVIACTSTSEGFSNVIGEAMACGVPCVATDVGDNALIVGSGGTLVPSGDTDALIAALSRIVELPDQSFQDLKVKAREQILKNFKIEDIARRYTAFFESIIRKRYGMESNLAPEVVAGFGAEWTRFDQQSLDTAERDNILDDYFRIFPWSRLGTSAIGADIGCGSGRWAKAAAPLVKKLTLVDASREALDVARHTLERAPNVEFIQASVGALPFGDESLDFVYSLGVLHHVPDTCAAIREIARVLKPGGPFLLYLYYALDNRPAWYRLIWRLSDYVRCVISRLPIRLRHFVCDLIAVCTYWPLARLAALVGKLGANADAMLLSYYRDKSFYTMRTDALDRFGTGLEQRFTRNDIDSMLRATGFCDIEFSPQMPYWVAIAYKNSTAAQS